MYDTVRRATSAVVLWILFVTGFSVCIGSRFVLHGATHVLAATIAGSLVALVTGVVVMRREPVKSFLVTRPALWFLFLFNLVAALCAGVCLRGPQGVMACVGMGAVAIWAGFGLLKRRRSATF